MQHQRTAFSRLPARVLTLAFVATALLLLQLGQPGSAAHAQGTPTWYLEDIRAFVCDTCHPDFVAAGSVAYQVVGASVNGGEVDVTADGGKAYPFFCPGGTEHFSFKWNFLTDASQFQLGSSIPVAMSAPTSTRSGACRGGPIANQAYLSVHGSSGDLLPSEASFSGASFSGASSIAADVTYIGTGAGLNVGQTGASGTQTVNIEPRLLGNESIQPRAIFTVDIGVNDVDILVVYIYNNGLTAPNPSLTAGGGTAGSSASGCADLSGSWYEASARLGTQGQPTSITQNGCSLTFTNEYGDTASGSFLNATTVVATGWSNLQGQLSGSGGSYTYINWANNTAWSRSSGGGTAGSSASGCADLSGSWYEASARLGTQGQPTSITQNGCSLTFTNEYGDTVSGSFLNATTVVATGWNNLQGQLSSSSGGSYTYISWANNTAWSRSSGGGTAGSSASGCADLSGSWYEASARLGTQGQPTSITQNGCSLTFTNEYGDTVSGSFLNATTVVATGWNNLQGQLSSSSGGSYTYISWANNTAWSRAGH